MYRVLLENRRHCQWHAIDAKLAELREQSKDYCGTCVPSYALARRTILANLCLTVESSFFKLVLLMDTRTFDGFATYASLVDTH